MAFEKQSGKVSGRTPEQQAARDARKAAKKASEVASTSVDITVDKEGDNAEPTSTEPETQGESSTAETKKRKHNTDVEELEVDLEAPTPLNKKEARLAKKKAKRVDEGEEESAEVESKPKPVPVEKRNSIWIGNLSFRTTGDRIKEFLENGVKELGGDEGCVTRVNLPKEKNKGEFGPSKGFAFVDFSSPENQKLAVDLSEKLLEGRKLLIKLGNDHTSNPEARTPKPVKQKGIEKQPHGESSTLFVGNLPFDATEDGLRDMIEASAAGASGSAGGAGAQGKSKKAESGSEDDEEDVKEEGEGEKEKELKGANRGGKLSGLRKVRLGAFEDTGRCKGFAFLDFLSPEQATAALINRGNKYYTNRKLILQYASDSATKRSGTGRRLGLPGSGPGGEKKFDDARPRRRPDVAGDEGRGGGSGGDGAYGERRDRNEGGEVKKDTRGKKWETAGRAAPGAALAAAKREKVGIVEGTGSKIVFD